MGEASIKVNHNGNGANKRVLELRDEIARKRDKISTELDELKRRRVEAISTAKSGAKFAGAGLVGFLCVTSLINAFRDLGRDDEEVTVLVEKEQDDRSILAVLMSAAVSIAISEIRGYAMTYAREKIREKIEEQRNQAA